MFFGVLGACIGSFLNVVVDRLPNKKSLLRPPSACDSCGRRLSAPDMVPVFSYILLKGRCRSCGAHIPLRVLLVELVTGIIFTLFYLQLGLTFELAVALIYSSIFIAIFIIDLERGIIPNLIVYPAAVLGLGMSFFRTDIDFVSALIGGAVGLVFLLLPLLVSEIVFKIHGMGPGDVKMAALIGITTGFPLVFIAILGAIFLGALVGVFLLLAKKRGRKDAIPFGTFLSIFTIITLAWGQQILNWYLQLY